MVTKGPKEMASGMRSNGREVGAGSPERPERAVPPGDCWAQDGGTRRASTSMTAAVKCKDADDEAVRSSGEWPPGRRADALSRNHAAWGV